MSSRLGPLEVECDAPPYTVVRACRELGMQSPEDVCWRRISHFNRRWMTLTNLFGPGSWAALLAGREGRDAGCSCGQTLPALETCSFVFRSGRSQSYQIGQCARCRTVYWEEA
jgi:hypothetical protein